MHPVPAPCLQVQEKEDTFKQTRIDALFGAAAKVGRRVGGGCVAAGVLAPCCAIGCVLLVALPCWRLAGALLVPCWRVEGCAAAAVGDNLCP